MATVDLTVGGTTKLASANAGKMTMLQKTLDFAVTSRSSGDVLQLFDIPAGTLVSHIVVDVQTAEGATCTADIGLTGVDVDGFVDGVNLNSAAQSCSAPGALVEGTPNTWNPAYANGKFFATTDTIDLLLNNDASAAKVVVSCFCTQP